jgi:hypothetical protein
MQSESQTQEAFKRQLPPDLLAVLATKKPKADELQVHAWQPSLFGRFVGMLAGKQRAR